MSKTNEELTLEQIQEKFDAREFFEICDWLREARPALTGGRFHNIAGILQQYKKYLEEVNT